MPSKIFVSDNISEFLVNMEPLLQNPLLSKIHHTVKTTMLSTLDPQKKKKKTAFQHLEKSLSISSGENWQAHEGNVPTIKNQW